MRESRFLIGAVGLVVIALIITLVLVVFALRSSLNHSTQALNRADIAITQSVRANQLSHAITEERRQTILQYCRAQNARHDATVHEINVLVAKRLKGHHLSPTERAQARASIQSTMLIINALAPKENCKKQLQQETLS